MSEQFPTNNVGYCFSWVLLLLLLFVCCCFCVFFIILFFQKICFVLLFCDCFVFVCFQKIACWRHVKFKYKLTLNHLLYAGWGRFWFRFVSIVVVCFLCGFFSEGFCGVGG